jgi:hypothetical protein
VNKKSNMKNYIKATFVAAGLLVATSCSISAPGMVTDNEAGKTGEASASYYFNIFGPRDADLSIEKAAKKGGITKVSTVDYKVESKFIKTTYTTIVTGK